MVELGNHQGRPPGYNSSIMPSEASSSLLDHWMNREMNLDFLDQSQEMYPQNYPMRNEIYIAGNPQGNEATGCHSSTELGLDDLRFDSPLSYEKDFFDIEGIALHESLPEFSSNENGDTLKDFAEKLSCQGTPLGFQSWGAPMDIDALKMEEVFQVDQSDLVQGPTLAALNSKDASDEFFLDLEFGYDFSKEENQLTAPLAINKPKSSNLTVTTSEANSTDTNSKLHSVGILSSTKIENKERDLSKSSLDKSQYIPKIKVELNETSNITPIRKGQLNQTSRAPTLAPASIVAARLAGRERKRSGLSISSISSTSSVSNDEGFGSQAEDDDDEEDDDDDGQVSSDEDSFISHTIKSRSKSSTDINRPTTSGVLSKTNKTKSSGRKKRYFWQYNIQSKGPKVCIPSQVLPGTSLDPHVLDDALDPVFSPECSLEGVKHAGKARRGDGNDLTPCPRKLHNIGLELNALNDMINDLTPVSDVPFNARPKSRKEKNKLASRACRLKKKAQHEANKLKLYGLQKEQRMMVALIPEVRQLLRELLSLKEQKSELKARHFQDALEKLLFRKNFAHVAGNTADFVNQVLDKVASGDPNGGLNDL